MCHTVRTGLVIALGLFLSLAGRADDRFVALQRKVWRVDTTGRIAPFSYEFPGLQMAGEFGSTYPLPSPDSRRIVFARDHDLHLLDVASGQERRITKLGRPQGECCASVETLVNAWSTDSRYIMFTVTHGETSGPAEDWDRDLLVCKAPYGFYTYEVATGTTQPLVLRTDFRFEAWLPDGAFLGTISQPKPCEERLQVFQPGQARGKAVAPRGSAFQVKVTSDEKWAVGIIGPCDAHLNSATAAIFKIDLTTGSATPLGPSNSWANQWPALSPDGDHFAYVHQERLAEHVFRQSLIVDEQPLYSCQGNIDYKWVDNRRIAAACDNEVLVLEIANRRPLSRYSRRQQ